MLLSLTTSFYRVITQFSQLAAFSALKFHVFELVTKYIFRQAILYYDYFLTLSDEVLLFWDANGRKRMGGLFLVNRYIQLFGNTVIILQDFGKVSKEVSVVLSIQNTEVLTRKYYHVRRGMF